MAVILACILLSCAGTVYSRNWVVNSVNLTDTLTISGDTFKLERLGQAGTSIFEGKYEEKGDQWAFGVTSWKPANAAAQKFDPPVRYIYRVKKFQNGVSFLVLVELQGTSPFQFIQKGDFELR
jgi:hypothetical protein